MKINDIVTEQTVNEGLGDFAKKVSRGISGAVAGVRANQGSNQGQAQINKSANIAFNNWNSKIVAGDPAAATDPEKLKQYAAQVASYYFKANGQVPEPPTPMTPANIKQYFVQLTGLNQTAAQGIKNTTPAQLGPAQPGPAQPGPAQPVQPSGNAMAQKLATDWKAFVDAGGNAGPAVKQQLKQMWLDAGGIKAESKKNKKQPV